MTGLALITVVATAFAPETYRDEIDETPTEEQRFVREGEPAIARPTLRPRAQPAGR
jgi:hypothetical protein